MLVARCGARCTDPHPFTAPRHLSRTTDSAAVHTAVKQDEAPHGLRPAHSVSHRNRPSDTAQLPARPPGAASRFKCGRKAVVTGCKCVHTRQGQWLRMQSTG
ncbi:hypothetical protein GCM10018773_04210 [Streptomyces candidus]|nr:hypothetical protein GCM10018773_04210 [Streptomyces candidus]